MASYDIKIPLDAEQRAVLQVACDEANVGRANPWPVERWVWEHIKEVAHHGAMLYWKHAQDDIVRENESTRLGSILNRKEH